MAILRFRRAAFNLALDSPVTGATMLSVMESLETTSLMPIGRFARLTGLSVKALRHYDELGLLRPAAVDASTGYRSYSTGQVGRAETIRLLRRLEFPLDEIASLLDADDPARVRRVLLDHQRRTALRSAQLKGVLQRLQPLLDGKESIMGTQARALDAETDKRLGIDLFNKTWTFLDMESRTREEDDEMLHCAHASAFHWFHVGTQANRARSEWQVSRVNAVLGRPEAALAHAERCLELVEGAPHQMEEFDLPAAYEALARAHLVAGNTAEAKRFHELGLAATGRIEDEEDRQIIEKDFATIRV
jgi:DNA-binding transcriptional MerR regulator